MGAVGVISFIVIVIMGLVYLIYELSKNPKLKKYDLDANSPIILNIPKKRFTKGYMLGQVDLASFRENNNGTYYVKYAPIDVLQGEEVPRPPMVDFVVLKGNLKKMAQGSPSDKRPIWMVTSGDPIDYPEEMKDTHEAKFMTHQGLLADMESRFQGASKVQSVATTNLMKKWSFGEMTALKQKQEEEDLERRKRLDEVKADEEGKK